MIEFIGGGILPPTAKGVIFGLFFAVFIAMMVLSWANINAEFPGYAKSRPKEYWTGVSVVVSLYLSYLVLRHA